MYLIISISNYYVITVSFQSLNKEFDLPLTTAPLLGSTYYVIVYSILIFNIKSLQNTLSTPSSWYVWKTDDFWIVYKSLYLVTHWLFSMLSRPCVANLEIFTFRRKSTWRYWFRSRCSDDHPPCRSLPILKLSRALLGPWYLEKDEEAVICCFVMKPLSMPRGPSPAVHTGSDKVKGRFKSQNK